MQNIEKTFTKDDLLKLKTRSIIYRFILKNPGLHFRELVRRLNIPRSTLSYHLNYLDKQELLIVKKDDRYTRYFISRDIGDREKKILNIIRVETTRNALLYIWGMVIASEIEIAKELDKHPTTINFHLKRLLKHGIIEPALTAEGIIYTGLRNVPIIKRKKTKNEIFYRIKEPAMRKLLIMCYKKGYYDDIIAETIYFCAEGLNPNGPPKRLNALKKSVEQAEEALFDIFPHPYYA